MSEEFKSLRYEFLASQSQRYELAINKLVAVANKQRALKVLGYSPVSK
jgi:hypothetical protein